MLSRPLFHTVLLSKPPRKHVTRARTHAFAGLGLDVASEPARESVAPPTEDFVYVGTYGFLPPQLRNVAYSIPYAPPGATYRLPTEPKGNGTTKRYA